MLPVTTSTGMDRNYLHHRDGDANNAILAAVRYNFRRLIRWLTTLWRFILAVLCTPINLQTD